MIKQRFVEDVLRRVLLAAVFLVGQVAADDALAVQGSGFVYKTTLSQVAYPTRMVEDADGNLYVTDFRSDKVYVFDRYGALFRVEVLSQPAAIAYDPFGGLVYVGTRQSGIYVLGETVARISAAAAGVPVDMDVDSQGNLYVVDEKAKVVKRFSCCSSGGGSGTADATFGNGGTWFPVSIEVGPGVAADGVTRGEYIYVGYSVDNSVANNTAMVMVYGGNLQAVRGFGRPYLPSDSYVGSAYAPDQLTEAVGIAVDGSGRIYVGDAFNERIIVFSETGQVMAVSLTIPELPIDLYYDRYGRLDVADQSGGVQIYIVEGDVSNVPPSAPTPVSPVAGANVSTAPELKIANATDKNGDSILYDFEVASDVAMTNIVWSASAVSAGDSTTSVTVGPVAGLREDTTYYWRARASDGIDYSKHSQVGYFFVNEVNNAPAINVGAVSPVSGSVSVEESADEATFNAVRFSVAGRDSDSVGFAAIWTVDGVEMLREYPANNAETAFVYQASRGTVGRHVVSVTLADARSGSEGERRTWGLTVYRYNSAPPAPGLHLPEDGADMKPLSDSAASLNTQRTVDAEGDALGYRFEISTVSDFTGVVASLDHDTLTDSLASVSIAGLQLVENARYYWHAKACETGDAALRGVVENKCSSWSSGRSFVVNDVNDVSTTPRLSYPGDGRTVDTLTPALQVMKSSDPDLNDVLTYEIEIATDGRFENLVKTVSGVAGDVGAGTVSWPYMPGGTVVWDGAALNDNTTYYWRSRAVDHAGAASAWMTAWFVVNTANDAPDFPSGMEVAPALDGNEMKIAVPVTLAVSGANDLDGDALTYTFEIDTANAFSSPNRLASAAQGSTAWTIPAVLADNTTYFWRVKASDGKSDSPWTTAASFFVNTVNDAPAAPILKSPLAAVHVPSATPVLSLYGATDIDGDGVSYTYEVSTDSTFATLDAGSGEGVAAVWTVDRLLRENNVYYWRARSTDEHGLSSDAWSAAGAFRVNLANDLPTAPVVDEQSVAVNGGITVSLSNSFDADGDGLTYEAEAYADRNLGRIVARVSGLAEGEDGKTLWKVGRLDNGTPQGSGVYYLRARACDVSACGGWSATRTLTIGGGQPDSRTDKAYGDRRF